MAKEKFRMPQSSGGLVTYFESTKQTINIKPEYVILVSAVIIGTEIALKFLF